MAETACTFVFTSFVLMIKYYNGADQMPINAYGVGFALYVAIRMASGISGGGINPAVGLFQSIFQKTANAAAFPKAEGTSLIYVIAYIFGPLMGGFLAGMFHHVFLDKAIATTEEKKKEELSKND